MEKTQKEIAQELAKRMGKNVTSVFAPLSKALNGRTRLPEGWEPHLITIVGCQNRNELRSAYPKIVFNDEPFGEGANGMNKVKLLAGSLPIHIRDVEIPRLLAAYRILYELGLLTGIDPV